ncbi:ECF RNA polymerase sigma-E factor [Arenibacter antarcticus]|uniref:RNA polymerase sigma factor n=1 Tax=Arenibacter antarcticus TaxID=2040469 RepID=A0ABW5VC70_9FLAO|nr:RNA polymerase sigma-70 factor [Arenibacter sp. H213]MCM4169381.1 RNA polymerase sigma-70 factor [Arenibacter sp. H213]
MKAKNLNDFTLLNALKKGDVKAYTVLVNNYHHKLCVYAFSLTNDSDLSEDIVQNVFMNIWRKRNALKGDLVLKSYLYKSVYNEVIDQYRKQKNMLPLEKKHLEALTSVMEDYDDYSLEKLSHMVKKEIEKLPPKCRHTFLLSKQDGLTNIEIAEYLNVSVKSVEAHITKAFFILRKSLDEKVHGILFILFRQKSFDQIS